MKKQILFFAGLFVLFISLAAQCDSSGENGPQITVVEPWARSSPMVAGNSAVYMELRNQGGGGDALIGAQTDAAEVAELHESKMEGDVMKMSPVAKIEIPAGGSAVLQPGGLHVMLVNLKQELVPGEKIKLMLNFETSAPLTIDAEIREVGAGMNQ